MYLKLRDMLQQCVPLKCAFPGMDFYCNCGLHCFTRDG